MLVAVAIVGGARRRLVPAVAVVCLAGVVSGCAYRDVGNLAKDATEGRNNGTPGSALARQYLIDELKPFAVGANTGAAGDAAYTQPFGGGTNVVAIVPGTDLADEYVVVGAHYDHLGHSCRTSDPADTVCNGATDNAAGVAVTLAIGRTLARQDPPPRRSIVLAFWDSEEDGLVGSRFYVQNPLVPLADTVAYINFDVYGANNSPSLRNSTIVVGAESGGTILQSTVRSAIDDQTLDVSMHSVAFGQGRSDHVNFLDVGIPSLFFTDATGPCYHTAQDEIGVVDFDKLNRQIAIALQVTRDMASIDTPPPFSVGPLATFDDAVALGRAVERWWNDRDRYNDVDRARIAEIRDHLQRVVNEGRDAFGSDDVSSVLSDAAIAVSILTHGECDGFLAPRS